MNVTNPPVDESVLSGAREIMKAGPASAGNTDEALAQIRSNRKVSVLPW